jgi:hypothetical protein
VEAPVARADGRTAKPFPRGRTRRLIPCRQDREEGRPASAAAWASCKVSPTTRASGSPEAWRGEWNRPWSRPPAPPCRGECRKGGSRPTPGGCPPTRIGRHHESKRPRLAGRAEMTAAAAGKAWTPPSPGSWRSLPRTRRATRERRAIRCAPPRRAGWEGNGDPSSQARLPGRLHRRIEAGGAGWRARRRRDSRRAG